MCNYCLSISDSSLLSLCLQWCQNGFALQTHFETIKLKRLGRWKPWRSKHVRLNLNPTARTMRLLTRPRCNGKVEIVPHPPYLPDLAPCDFFLFANLKNFLLEGEGEKRSSNFFYYNRGYLCCTRVLCKVPHNFFFWRNKIIGIWLAQMCWAQWRLRWKIVLFLLDLSIHPGVLQNS